MRFIAQARRSRSNLFGALVLVAVAILLAEPAVAQVDRSGLSGTVMDSSSRVLPGVRVVALKSDSGLRLETVSSGSGSYDIPEFLRRAKAL